MSTPNNDLLSRSLSRAKSAAEENLVLAGLVEFRREVSGNRIVTLSVAFLLFVSFLAASGSAITPYDYSERQYDENGDLLRGEAPSTDHWLGTTEGGQDVLSRLIYGSRASLLTGVAGGMLIVSMGLVVGTAAGYFGGLVDETLMRIVDVLYGVPLIPFAIVLVAYVGIGFWSTILIIGGLLWRGNSRVFRSQVLQIKERSYVRSARASGASDLYIMVHHIIPNMIGMVVLFLALGIGISIIVAASLAFLGFMDPFVPSWGVMLRNAYNSGFMLEAWWWSLPPGFMISFTVLSTFLIGREYEKIQETRTEQATL